MTENNAARIHGEALRGAMPDEDRLRQMIESGVLHILVLGQAGSVLAYDPVLDAARLYRRRHGEARLHIVAPPTIWDALLALARAYRVDSSLEILTGDDSDALLTDFLGSHAAVLVEDDELVAALAQSFYLPVIFLRDKKEISLRGRLLEIGDDSAALAGVFAVIKRGKYEEQLAGIEFRAKKEG